jgi:adenosylhomocysteinase
MQEGDRMSRLEWVDESMRLVRSIGDEFERTRPFDGLTIGTGIHLEPKTAALLLTLRRGGAEVIATGNLNSTQAETVTYLEARGIRVVGTRTQDAGEHDAHVGELLDAAPQLLLDNGGDLFAAWLQRPYAGLLGGTEETTSGRMRLAPLRDQLRLPILVINDSPIKQFAENEHAVGQSVLESFLRITNRATNGLRVTVFGYGACGQGVAANFRAAHASVSVVDVDPVARLRALWDGFTVPSREEAVASADLVVTVTGARGVITGADLARLRDGAVLVNAGHFPYELDVPGLAADPAVVSSEDTADGITSLRLRDGRSVRILVDGHMVNLAGPRPLGNSIEAMDLGFALQARCLEAVARGAVGPEACVVPVPRSIDEAVATAFVERS